MKTISSTSVGACRGKPLLSDPVKQKNDKPLLVLRKKIMVYEEHVDYLTEGFPGHMNSDKKQEIINLLSEDLENCEDRRDTIRKLRDVLPENFWYSFYDQDSKPKQDEDSKLFNVVSMYNTIINKMYRINEFRDCKENMDLFPIVRIVTIIDIACKNCIKRKDKIIRAEDLKLTDLPPFRDCLHEEDGTCRCGIEQLMEEEL